MTHVSDIRVNEKDSAGDIVRVVYARRPPDYAVYGTDSRVAIQLADDPTKEQAQRAAMVKISATRTAVANLIEDWRSSEKAKVKAKAKRYDGRVANALIALMEGDVDSADGLLKQIRDDIVDERTSWARFEYLIVAAAGCMISIFLCALLSLKWLWVHVFHFQAEQVGALWLAAGTGAAGAFFSIAIAIRGRTVLTDLRSRDNFSDAILRIFIGAMAGALLIGLLLSKLISFKLQNTEFDVVGASNWLALMIAAFIGGFSERLVPDLLAKAAADNPTSPPVPPAVNAKAPGAGQPAVASQATNVQDPAEATDNCPTASGVSDAEAIPDSELPPAVGGVAPAAASQE